MTDESADWIYTTVLATAPGITLTHLAGGRCTCQGGAQWCNHCGNGLHEGCQGRVFGHEGYLFGPGFAWPPLTVVWLADRLCQRPCACPSCHPPAEPHQLDLFAAASNA